MEKYSQFRDRGSGIAPFTPIFTPTSKIYLPIRIFIFLARLPIFVALTLGYFIVLQCLPLGSLFKKAMLWMILGVPGVWWVDLQVDGVKKGSLAKHSPRLPNPSNIIASSFTSPIDALYLAAIFDPIFTASYPTTRLIHRISLLRAILRALSPPQSRPLPGTALTDLGTLLRDHPNRIIVVFPETTTTNGRGILPFSPSLLTAPSTTRIFPVSVRYTPPDITTPVPHAYWAFLWNLLSRPTHCIRVRIAECVYNGPEGYPYPQRATPQPSSKSTHATNYLDTPPSSSEAEDITPSRKASSINNGDITTDEKRLLEKVGEALARLGRVKRVGLGVRDKVAFVEVWERQNYRRFRWLR
ncbi:hypothetical protein FGG08_001000 [Glutinoglossum americanum]|uniref:Phospholipid/glycerol acyltransferase domain-containing protein n=1 Tax=Glutinoglossum americanum TaxID=1670608 RepID=A0A9P8L5N5_9PEZI|nr:hypothetical protein FGG08_001000 [Glutinoglossum americanum]